MNKDFDVVVIGAGSGGLTAAIGFAKVGKRVLLIEREHMGGECTNSGCVPSKALLHFAKEHYAGNPKYAKLGEALPYVRSKIEAIRAEESVDELEKHGIATVMGEAKFTAPCVVEVNGTAYRFKKAVIATGSSPRTTEIAGLNTEDLLTNQTIFGLTELPKRLLIIGSGPIGLEMANAFALLGTKVTIATIDTTLARLEEPAVAKLLQERFKELDIAVILRAFINEVRGREAVIDIKDGETIIGQETAAFDKVLVAIGRVPNLPQGLEAAGIQFNQHGIEVDSQHRTSNRHVYAVGDVAQRLKFTHTANDVARQVVTHVVSRGLLRFDSDKAVPKVTYTEPEMAQVGLSYAAAVEKYSEAEVMRIEVPYEDSDRAKTDNNTTGVVIVSVRRLSGTVLGASIAGQHAGELISIFTLAIDQKLSLWRLRRLIFAYPTYGLLIKKAADVFFAEQLRNLKADFLFLLKKHAPKLIALTFWLALIYTFQHYRISHHLTYRDMLLSLYEFFTMSMWGPLIYIVLYALRPLILFPATLLTALSGALFGLWWGILYTVIGENMSANLAYSIGRFFGKDLRLEDTFMGHWVEWLRARPFESVLFMRLFYVPFDLANYGSGVLKVSWPSYALATFVGIIPGLTTFVALGAAVDVMELRMEGLSFNAFDPRYLALSVSLFVTSVVLSRYLKRWKATQ
ncbi:FAD-dependent oxidoreductase [Candidatus Kaiserbacteria bacterium]|nr:FAD-dependent oxidoreductase [Candidatus Kaiserbacteria bacterium]MCB9811424.1 FAD-dependent oxidoreductase [Candidatus Nomurabacteria bacterium]